MVIVRTFVKYKFVNAMKKMKITFKPNTRDNHSSL